MTKLEKLQALINEGHVTSNYLKDKIFLEAIEEMNLKIAENEDIIKHLQKRLSQLELGQSRC